MRFKDLIFKNRPLLLLIGLSLLLPAIWLREGLVVAYAEGGFTHFLIEPLRLLSIAKYTWWDIFGFGIENIRALPLTSYALLASGLQVFKIPPIVRQYLIFAAILLLSTISMYFLVIELVNKKKKLQLVALWAALFYILNPYTMNVWHRFASAIFGLPLPPLIFLLAIRLFRKASFLSAFLFGATVLLFSVNAVNPGYFIPFFLPAIFYVIYQTFCDRQFGQWKYFGLSIFLAAGLVFWWILPLLFGIWQEPYSVGFLNDIGTLQAISQRTPLLFISRLIDVSTIHWYGVNYYPGWIEFLIPALAIVAILLGKKNNKVLFFGLLLIMGLFLSKGLQPPGGAVFEWMFYHLPFFGMFRSPFEKFGLIVAFSYAFLVSFGLYSLGSKIKNETWNRAILLIVSILLLGISVWPMWTGELFSFWEGIIAEGVEVPTAEVEIPEYWHQAASFINQDKRDYRIIFLPQAPLDQIVYRWDHGYWGADFGSVNLLFNNPVITHLIWASHADAYRRLVLEDLFLAGNKVYPVLFSFMNTEYVFVRNDINEEALRGMILAMKPVPLTKINQIMDSSDFFNKVSSFGKLDLYELANQYFLPHFYIPQKIIYLNGGVEDLSHVASLEGDEIRSSTYLADTLGGKEEIGLDRAKEVIVKADLRTEEELGRIAPGLESLENVFFPYVRWRPDSFFHSLVLKKEDYNEWRLKNDPKELFEKKLFYATKRIAEMEKWGLTLGGDDWKETVKRYEQKMGEAFDLLERIKIEGKEDLLPLLSKLEASLQIHQKRMEKLGLNKERRVEFDNVLKDLKGRRDKVRVKHDSSQLVYEVDIPREGDYQLLIKNEDYNQHLRDKQLKLEFLGEEIIVPLVSESNDWLTAGNYELKAGKEELKLTKPETVNLLEPKGWQNHLAESVFVKEGILTFPQLESLFPTDTDVYFESMEEYQSGTNYRLVFDYSAAEDEAGIFLIETIDLGGKKAGAVIKETLPETILDSTGYFEKVFRSNPVAEKAEFYFWIKTKRKREDTRIFNLKIEKLFKPAIILRRDQPQEPFQTPKITFTKINPTKYRVKVEKATEPYFLIFSETFNDNWRAYIQTSDVELQMPGQIIASYFDGEIRESSHRRTFLGRDTFETWGKEPIAEDKHLLANGYANSWFLTPEDAGEKENYEIIIEFWPQRLFYLGLGVSFLVMLGCLGYLGIALVRKKNKK
jgi:hypothetical protein